MTTLSEILSLTEPLFPTGTRKQAYRIFSQCLKHLDNKFGMLYLLDMEDHKFPEKVLFRGSVYEGQVGSWYQEIFDANSAFQFIMELSRQLERTDKTHRLALMVYEMDSTPLTVPDYRVPDYSYLWVMKDGAVLPSDDSFFMYNDEIFETVPGPALVDGVMEFEIPQQSVLNQKETEAARTFATDLSRDLFKRLIFPRLPDGIHKLSMVTSMGEVTIQVVKSGENLVYSLQNITLPLFLSVFSDFVFRNIDFRLLLRSSAVAEPIPYLKDKPGYELDELDSTLTGWLVVEKKITPMTAQDTIDFLCLDEDGTIISPPKNFSYIDAWLK